MKQFLDKTPYKSIAAYEGEESISAIDRILQDHEFKVWFRKTTGHHFPAFLRKLLVRILRFGDDPLKVIDKLLVVPFFSGILRRSSTSCTLQGLENAPTQGSAFFITNHRDIVLDAALLAVLLLKQKRERIYFGVGNNLYGRPWIEDMMRMAGCFSVIRNGGPREVGTNARLLSDYIACLQREGRSIWMAQREGRAKDGNDTTQPAVLKMLTLAAGDGELIDIVKALNITPVAITYTYDPCDYLKAQEMQLKRDNPDYRKTSKDDMRNMQTGLRGQKGDIRFNITPSINADLDTLAAEWATLDKPLTRNEQLAAIAHIIDRHIHQGYILPWTNLAAKTILEGGSDQRFEEYIRQRIELIHIDNRDDTFLRQALITMYANPAINHLANKH